MNPRTRIGSSGVLTPRSHAASGYEPAAFRETVSGPGTWAVGYVTAWESDLAIGRAVAAGRPVTVHTYCTLTIEGRASRSRTLGVVIHPKRLTQRQAEELMHIEFREHQAHLVRDADGRVYGVEAGFAFTPRVQTSILLERGWLTRPPHSDRIWISAAGRMALAYQWHREQGLHSRVLKGLYLDAALASADIARADLREAAAV